MTTRAFLRRRRRGIVERVLAPSFGTCLRCHRPWKYAKHHSTPISNGRACFPLCEPCWSELTPVERWPFYMDLVLSYWETPPNETREILAALKKNVMEMGL